MYDCNDRYRWCGEDFNDIVEQSKKVSHIWKQ